MDIATKKTIVADFLARCNRYADGQLQKYREQLSGASGATGATGAEALAIQDKIGHWTAYRAFNEHALGELAGRELDDWFA